MLWWIVTRALFFGLVATFDLNRVSPTTTAVVRSTIAIGTAVIQRIRLAIKAERNDELDVPNSLIIIEHDDAFEVMMDVFGHLSLYQAACATVIIPEKLMMKPMVAAVSSIYNCCIISPCSKDIPNATHVIIVPQCDDTEQFIEDFRGKKVRASRTTSRLHFSTVEAESDLSDEVKTVI